MKLLRSAGLVFIFIAAFQFVNIRYFGGAIFSLSSQDKFPVPTNGSRIPITPLSSPRSVEVVAEVERIGLEEDNISSFDKNDTIQSNDSFVEDFKAKNDTIRSNDSFVEVEDVKDKESLDLMREARNSSKESEGRIVEDDAEVVDEHSRKVEILEGKSNGSVDNVSPEVKRVMNVSNSGVVSISEMMSLLHQSRVSHVPLKLKQSSAVDQELLDARIQIENPPMVDNDRILHGPLYWNLSMFKRSYELMEKKLKVYVYREGQQPVLHKPKLKGIYASEGWFMKQLKSSKFVTKNPRQAHLFYLPFSSKKLEETLYVPGSHSDKNLIEFLKKYLDLISSKYNFWNKTGGTDHFLVACHDWAPSETRQYMSKCIRALCNSDVSEGFVFGKDVALPETTILVPKKPLRALGGKPVSQRQILAFFAGGMHGYLRPRLLQT